MIDVTREVEQSEDFLLQIAHVIAAPLKIVGGSGSPLRVIAIAP